MRPNFQCRLFSRNTLVYTLEMTFERKIWKIHGILMSTYKFEKIIFVFSNSICTYMKGSTNTSFVLIQFCSTNEKLVNSLIQSMKLNYSQLIKYYKNALIIATQQLNVIIATVCNNNFIYFKWLRYP